jgi:hypothetical protein
MKANSIERLVHESYLRLIRPYISREINRQRVKLIWKVWGYWFFLLINTLPLLDRLRLLIRFLRVDWNVVHAQLPAEISMVCQAIAQRQAIFGEVLIEAGCWQGGSSAKLSIICKMLGYRLCIYDSFEGVEPLSQEEKKDSYDFSGEYASPESVLRKNLTRFGEPNVCSIHKGWFADTLAICPTI